MVAPVLHVRRPGAFPHYDNPEVCELYRKARSTPDEAVVKDTYEQIARILNDEVPMGWLWQMKQSPRGDRQVGRWLRDLPQRPRVFLPHRDLGDRP